MVPVPVARVGHRHLGSEELDQLYADGKPKQTHQRDRCAQAPMDRREFYVHGLSLLKCRQILPAKLPE